MGWRPPRTRAGHENGVRRIAKGKGGGKHYSPNDMRSMAKNPNNPASKAASDNRANQLNPEKTAYASSRKGSTTEAERSEGEDSED